MKKAFAVLLCTLLMLGTIGGSVEPSFAASKISAPSGVTVETNKSGNPVITWDAVDSAVKYKVYRKTESDSDWVKITSTSKLKSTDTKWTADEGTTIKYVVKASAKKDGKTVWSKNSKAVKWTVPTKEITKDTGKKDNSDNTDKNTSGTKYVLNTNTKKIHYPSCKDVEKIKKENYATTDKSISALESQGYSRCKHCNPK